jgi:hypothetical protein
LIDPKLTRIGCAFLAKGTLSGPSATDVILSAAALQAEGEEPALSEKVKQPALRESAQKRHPERSRSSGGAKDLPLNRPSA